jgi:hypothetical protein
VGNYEQEFGVPHDKKFLDSHPDHSFSDFFVFSNSAQMTPVVDLRGEKFL